MRFAPRIDPRLLVLIRKLDDRTVPIAETSRRVGAAAEELGLARPSYARVRRLVHVEREYRDAAGEPAFDVVAPLLQGRLPDRYRLESRRSRRRRTT